MSTDIPLEAPQISPMQANANCLAREIAWFSQILNLQMALHLGQETEFENILDIPPPNLEGDVSMYAKVVEHYKLSMGERLILILSLLPHVQPAVLDQFYSTNTATNRGFTQFGGINGQSHGGFLPTGETAVFLIAGNDINIRLQVQKIFDKNHVFHKHQILRLQDAGEQEPILSGLISISAEYLTYFTTGEEYVPPFNGRFPAKSIDTQLEWKDLIVSHELKTAINEVLGWMKYGHILMQDWGLNKMIRPGFRCLFYGPPGTGKTLTATLLGKSVGRQVYRIDLSKVISKYIGETEKNLANVFDTAENKNWILFFDEADSLFSKRTETRNSNDRSANQQVAYLLQRIEDYNGVAILASNLKQNMDEAFTRRFDAIIYFPIPNKEQRRSLWEKYFLGEDKYFDLEPNIDFDVLAEKYEFSGGNIINVLRSCCISVINRNEKLIKANDLRMGIRKEYLKMGKTPV